MSKTMMRVGPADHGRPMSLDDFEECEAAEGHLYELSRGVVAVIQVPKGKHLVQVQAARDQFVAFKLQHPALIHAVAGGAECKILVDDLQSERHPDVAVYLTPLPPLENPWRVWVPKIVVEVVSPGSEHRDYEEKREEYLRVGVSEYWILDHQKRQMLALRRRSGRWVRRVISPPRLYRTRLLPGFEFACGSVFAAADAAT